MVTIMPKGQFPILKVVICNIITDTSHITNVLPHGTDSSGVTMVKLQSKLSFRGHIFFRLVSPESVYLAVNYLMLKNWYYKDITTNMVTLPSDLSDFVGQSEADCPGPSDTLEKDKNPSIKKTSISDSKNYTQLFASEVIDYIFYALWNS